jgi:hypothetical protein
VTCGLAVLDPAAGGPVPDPAGELPAHLPIPFAGRALALTAVYPPALGGLKEDGTPATSAAEAAFQKQATETSTRWVSTLAAVASSTGAVYLIDLARGAPALDRDVLATTTSGAQARVTAVTSSTPPTADHPFLGLWDKSADPAVSSDPDKMRPLATMTPGYTPNETWQLVWEGRLPNLDVVKAQLQSKPTRDGLAWLAVQSAPDAANPVSGPFRRTLVRARSADGLVPGDIVVVTPSDASACPKGVFELEVTGFLVPDPASYPGGAVEVSPRTGPGAPGDPHCLDTADRSVVQVTFRAGGLILTGPAFGYGGRPAIATATTAAEPGFSLAWQDTSGLSCPLDLDSTAWPPPPGPTCDQTCRDTCETILLARKARRGFYVAEKCLATDTECSTSWESGPVVNPLGPVLAFKPGWVYREGASGTTPPARDTSLEIRTSSGLVPMARRPLSGTNPIGATLPSGLATFDRSAATGLEASGVRVFAAYPSNLVLDFSPSLGAPAVAVYK